MNHICTSCEPGTTNEAGDDASGGNTSCDVNLCVENEYVFENQCNPCPPGTNNEGGGDDPSGQDTICDVIFCNNNEYVLNHLCT